jgi:hypothetical protein
VTLLALVLVLVLRRRDRPSFLRSRDRPRPRPRSDGEEIDDDDEDDDEHEHDWGHLSIHQDGSIYYCGPEPLVLGSAFHRLWPVTCKKSLPLISLKL